MGYLDNISVPALLNINKLAISMADKEAKAVNKK